jgi:hypothetical protein
MEMMRIMAARKKIGRPKGSRNKRKDPITMLRKAGLIKKVPARGRPRGSTNKRKAPTQQDIRDLIEVVRTLEQAKRDHLHHLQETDQRIIAVIDRHAQGGMGYNAMMTEIVALRDAINKLIGNASNGTQERLGISTAA